jgi:ferredoxin
MFFSRFYNTKAKLIFADKYWKHLDNALYSIKDKSHMPTVSVVEIDDLCNEIPDTKRDFQVDSGSVLFDALDDQGHKLAHGCLAGSCGSCRILVLEGADNFAAMSFVEDNTVSNLKEDYAQRKGQDFIEGKVIRLSCRAKVNGDIKIAILPE